MRRTKAILAGLTFFLGLCGPAAEAQNFPADPVLKPNAPVDPHRPLAQELDSSASPFLSVTSVGTLLLNAPDAPPVIDSWVAGMLNGTAQSSAGPNVSVGTLQGPIFDLKSTKAFPYPWNSAAADWSPTPYPNPQFPVLRSSPATAALLRQSGFNALMLANDHTLDWGIEGMRATAATLDANGIVRAGAGETGSLAAHANYVEQAAGAGRVAFVSTATTFRPTSNALDSRGAAPGRPGVAGIELAATRLLPTEQFSRLQAIACAYAYPGAVAACPKTDTVSLFNNSFVVSTAPENDDTTRYDIDRFEAERFVHAIREGKESADLLVASIHAGQVENARSTSYPTPAFLRALAHSAIDAGADIVAATGLPYVGAIEIYRPASGVPRPIFYGLGSFLWTPGLAPALSNYNSTSILVKTTINGYYLTVDIFPLDLSATGTLPAGSPHLAAKDKALAVLSQLQQLSAPFGTTISMVNYQQTAQGRISVPLSPAK